MRKWSSKATATAAPNASIRPRLADPTERSPILNRQNESTFTPVRPCLRHRLFSPAILSDLEIGAVNGALPGSPGREVHPFERFVPLKKRIEKRIV